MMDSSPGLYAVKAEWGEWVGHHERSQRRHDAMNRFQHSRSRRETMPPLHATYA